MSKTKQLILSREAYLSLTKESLLSVVKPLLATEEHKNSWAFCCEEGWAPITKETLLDELLEWQRKGVFPTTPEDLDDEDRLENTPFHSEEEWCQANERFYEVQESLTVRDLLELIYS